MDNLTHSLMGAAFARALPKRFRRPEIYWACIIGNNAPDIDLVPPYLPGRDTLSYLLYHRGYTHTFLIAPVMGILSAVVAKKFYPARSWSSSLFIFGIFGCLMHIGADYLNNYGVHPFTPFLNRWFYGDSMFIVEPLIWFALIPFIAREANQVWSRIAWWFLGFSMIGIVWLFPNFSIGLAALLSIFFAASIGLDFYFQSRFQRIATALFLFFGILGGFWYGGSIARKTTLGAWQSSSEGDETWLDTASNPMPGNPLCWTIWIASKTSNEFKFRSAVFSLWPEVVPPTSCDPVQKKSRTAEVRPVTFSSGARLHWMDESNLSFSDWERLRKVSSIFRRFLSFARFPFIKRLPDGGMIAGDLRYDHEEGLGFAEVQIPADEMDDAKIGPWIAPLDRGKKTP